MVKPVQINVYDGYIFALCEDGTIWSKSLSPSAAWEKFRDCPTLNASYISNTMPKCVGIYSAFPQTQK